MVIEQGHVSHHKSSHLEMGRMTDTYQLKIHSHDDLQGIRHLPWWRRKLPGEPRACQLGGATLPLVLHLQRAQGRAPPSELAAVTAFSLLASQGLF